MLEASTIIALTSGHVLNQAIWTLVLTFNASIKLSLPNIIQRFMKQDQCSVEALHTIFSANNSVLALELWLLITRENLSVSHYWNVLMKHPILYCYVED